MKLPLTGGCQCAAVRYEIAEAPVATYACHCVDCQRMTSSAFSMAIVVPDAAFHLTGREPRTISRTADSGRVATRLVCPECGSWVSSATRPGAPLRTVRGGTLDDTSWLLPTVHLWTRSKQNWIVLPENSRSFGTQPPDLMALWASMQERAVG